MVEKYAIEHEDAKYLPTDKQNKIIEK